MSRSSFLKPSHKAIKQYYQGLEEYRDRRVKSEGAVETAVQRLLDSVARVVGSDVIRNATLGRRFQGGL